jgi:hypothetical protein
MPASKPIKIPSQARDLNTEPDPQEPSFSYEEKLINQSSFLSVRDEDELYRLTARTNQRIRNGSSTANSNNNSCHLNLSNITSSSGPQFYSSEMKPELRNNVMSFNNDVAGLRSSSNVVCVYLMQYYALQYAQRMDKLRYRLSFSLLSCLF